MRNLLRTRGVFLVFGLACGFLGAWLLGRDGGGNERGGENAHAGFQGRSELANIPFVQATRSEGQELPDAVHAETKALVDEYARLAAGEAGRPNSELVRRLSEVLQTNDESRRTLHFSLLLEAMRAEDAPEIASMFADLRRRGLAFDPEANFFAQRWGEVDPDEALAYVVEDGNFERGGVLLQRVMSGWASKDPHNAALWIMEQQEGPLKEVGIEGAATGWGRTEPDGATAFLLALPHGRTRESAVRTVFWQVLYGRGIETAAAWYDALPAEEVGLRKAVFYELSQRQLQRGEPEAQAWVAERQGVMTP